MIGRTLKINERGKENVDDVETDGILNIGVAPRTAQRNYILVK